MFTKLLSLFIVVVVSQGRPQGQEHHGSTPFTVFSSDHLLLSAPVLSTPVQVATPVHVAVPTETHHEEHHSIDYHAHPKYEFKYGVEDPHTHDQKSQHENRDGEHTQGEYTLKEPDGTELKVHYSVEGKSGFNAIVERKGHAVHPQHYKTYGHTN